ncbi:hypothetical protein Tco_0072513 [Tanacetum coccineum]
MIVDCKIISEGKVSSYLIIRADGSSKRYTSMIHLLQNIDREDLENLWKLVKAKYGDTRPEEAYERVLFGDLKVMFERDMCGSYKDIFMNLMLSRRLQVEEDSEMAKDLIMKIFIEANKPRR